MRDLVVFVQFKKREKHPLRSVNFSKVAGFSYCTSATKSRNATHISKSNKFIQKQSSFCKKVFLKVSKNLQGECPWRSLFLNKAVFLRGNLSYSFCLFRWVDKAAEVFAGSNRSEHQTDGMTTVLTFLLHSFQLDKVFIM